MKIKANNENEALDIARKELDLHDGNYTLKILREPKQSWINVVKKMGIYEISLLEKNQESQVPSVESDAYVTIKGGKIEVYNPLDDENFPILYIKDDHITLTVNDQVIKSHTTLKEKDVIIVTSSPIEPITNISLTLSKDKMEATLNVIREEGKSFYLKDMERTTRGFVEVGWEKVSPQNITLEQCLDLLENAHIQQRFIDIESIKALIHDTNSCSKVVAKGVPLKESEPAEVTYCEALGVKKITEGLEPIVNIDETLAFKKHVATLGIAGLTLTDQEIKPKNVVDILLQAGEGALLVEDGTRVIAAINGRPYLKKGIITVVPIQYVNGDLSKIVGNINFEGDVIVKGNVLDEMSIHATGNIEITKSTYHSNIIAKGSISINGKAIGCKIQSGADISKLYLVIGYFQEINDNIMDMFQKIKAHESSLAHAKLNIIYAYKELIDKEIKSICEVSSLMDQEDTLQVIDLIKHLKDGLLQTTLLKKTGFMMLLTFYNEVEGFIEEINQLSDEANTITLSYAQSCDIHCCGNIILTGKGTYQTNMVAQNEIIYTNPISIVKGGTLIAGSKITAGIVGTVGEVYTECRVLQEEGTVKGNFYRGSVVYIHNIKQDIVTRSS